MGTWLDESINLAKYSFGKDPATMSLSFSAIFVAKSSGIAETNESCLDKKEAVGAEQETVVELMEVEVSSTKGKEDERV